VFELLASAGWIMFPLGLCSILVLGIGAERFWTLRRKSVMPDGLLDEVVAFAKSRKLDHDHVRQLAENSALGSVLAAVLRNRARARDLMREKIEEAGRKAVHELGRFLNALGTIAIISPLLGLLGTVFGLIRMFIVVTNGGIGDAQKLAGGIGQALIATAAGLCVAIAAYVAHRYFRGRIQNYAIELEGEATSLLDALDGN
jgi:biopolymer transport protein ExbB